MARQTWLEFGRIVHFPLLRRVSRDGKKASADRHIDKHVVRLGQKTALAAGLCGDLPESKGRKKFSAHSVPAGLATAAEVDERYVQKQLGHAGAEITRRYQHRRYKFPGKI